MYICAHCPFLDFLQPFPSPPRHLPSFLPSFLFFWSCLIFDLFNNNSWLPTPGPSQYFILLPTASWLPTAYCLLTND